MELYSKRLRYTSVFGIFTDKRTKQLDHIIRLIGERADDETKLLLLQKIKAASTQFIKPFPEISKFEDLKFALRPDQAKEMALKAEDLQSHVSSYALGDEMDGMVFYLLAVSLRHKAGDTWVQDMQVKFVDYMISIAEELDI